MFSTSLPRALVVVVAALSTLSFAIPTALTTVGSDLSARHTDQSLVDLLNEIEVEISKVNVAPVVGVAADVDVLEEVKPVVVIPKSTRATRATPQPSIPDIIVGLTVDLDGALQELKVILAVEGPVNIDLVVKVFATVEALLHGAVAELHGLSGLALNTLLSINGKVLAIVDLAGLVSSLLNTLTAIILCVVVALGKFNQQHALDGVLAAVLKLVGELIAILLFLVGGLKEALGPLLATLNAVVANLGLQDLIAAAVVV